MPKYKFLDVERAVAVIEAEHKLIRDLLVERTDSGWACTNAGHCALGALLHAAGVDNDRLASMSADSYELPVNIINLLTREYGIRRYHANLIIDQNDTTTSEPERRTGVIRLIRDLGNDCRDRPEEDRDVSVRESMGGDLIYNGVTA